MKNLKSIALALVAFVTLSTTAQVSKKVDVSKSTINWVGKKVTGAHEGTINLKEGKLIFNGKKLVGGNFTVDMKSVSTTDLSGGMKEKLDGHLKSDDFFGTEKFPTATLVFKSIGEKGNGDDTVTAALKIDRTKYDIKYGSGSFFDGLGDKAIYDEFDLTVKLAF